MSMDDATGRDATDDGVCAFNYTHHRIRTCVPECVRACVWVWGGGIDMPGGSENKNPFRGDCARLSLFGWQLLVDRANTYLNATRSCYYFYSEIWRHP